MTAAFDRDPNYAYGDRQAVADGALVDLLTLGVKVHFEGRPITRMSAALNDTLVKFIGDGTVAEQAAAMQAALGFIVAGAHDTAEPGEPSGELYRTPSHHALDHQPVWLTPNDDGWTVMFASDW